MSSTEIKVEGYEVARYEVKIAGKSTRTFYNEESAVKYAIANKNNFLSLEKILSAIIDL